MTSPSPLQSASSDLGSGGVVVTRLSRSVAVGFDSQRLQEDCERFTAKRLGLSYPPLLETLPSLGITTLPFSTRSVLDDSSFRKGPLWKHKFMRRGLFDDVGTNGGNTKTTISTDFELEDGLWNFEREAIMNAKSKHRAAKSGEDEMIELQHQPRDLPQHRSKSVDQLAPSSRTGPTCATFSPVLSRLRERLQELTAADEKSSICVHLPSPKSAGEGDPLFPVNLAEMPFLGGIGSGILDESQVMSRHLTEKSFGLQQQQQSMGRRSSRRSRWSVVDEHLNFVSARASVSEESTVTLESETNLPVKYLHIYLQYCALQKMTILIRPVSDSVPDLYAGTCMLDKLHTTADGAPQMCGPDESYSDVLSYTTYECRVKGKSIQVTLKSSPYPPIDGCIPVNPALGKAYIDAQRRERELEDMLLSAATGLATVFVRKLKAQKAHASAMTAAFVRDTQLALKDSDKRFEELMAKYRDEVVMTTDKLGVSRRYIDKLNDAQFLGVAQAKWRGWPVYYTEIPNSAGTVLRDERDVPVFHIRKGDDYFRYDAVERDVMKETVAADELDAMRPVQIVTHRTFYISKGSARIEEDQSPFIIGPDFDGLSYAQNYHFNEFGEPRRDDLNPWTAEDHIWWANQVTTLSLRDGMGLTCDLDETHISLIRFLTDWKQNHGYECHNVVKSQAISRGNYICITPTTFFVLRDFADIIAYYRCAWKDGTPLLLNPAWKVAIRVEDGLPCPYGEEFDMPIVDDCGYADLSLEVERYEKTFDVSPRGSLLPKLAAAYVPMESKRQLGHKAAKVTKLMSFSSADSVLTLSELEGRYSLVFDKKTVAKHFFELRRWQLLPGRFVAAASSSAGLYGSEEATGSMRMAATGTMIGNAAVQRGAPATAAGGTLASPRQAGLASTASVVEPLPSTTSLADVELCSVFEAYRRSRVAPLLAAFDRCVAAFDEFHPEHKAFTEMLEHFARPHDAL